MSRTLAALAVLPLALAGAGWLRSAPPPAQRVTDAPVPAARVDLTPISPLSRPQEGLQPPGGAFLVRFGAAYRGEGPPDLAMRSAAVPVAVQTVQTVQTVQPSVQIVRNIRNADRADRADSRAAAKDNRPLSFAPRRGLCARHGLRQVWVDKYRWRCRSEGR